MAAVIAAAILAAVPLAIEGLVRRMGFGSVPLYEPSPHGGYRMRPNQAARFMRRYAWRYDANGMRNQEMPPTFAETSLLIGDSVVDGGLRIDQNQTLAALAARHAGESFYSVACPGWSLANCLSALRALPGWTRAKRLIFVLNTGDLDTVAAMENELSFPTRRPIWLTLWLARRHAYRRFPAFPPVRRSKRELAPPLVDGVQDLRASNLAAFRGLLAEYQGPVLLVRYPMRGEDARTELYFEQLAALDPRIRILEAADAAGWSEDCYADHIHPNARGLEILARHLCQGLN